MNSKEVRQYIFFSSISVPHICEAKIPPIIGCVCFIMYGDNDHAEWEKTVDPWPSFSDG